MVIIIKLPWKACRTLYYATVAKLGHFEELVEHVEVRRLKFVFSNFERRNCFTVLVVNGKILLNGAHLYPLARVEFKGIENIWRNAKKCGIVRVLDKLRDYTCIFMSGFKFHSRKARFAPIFVPILCSFLRDELGVWNWFPSAGLAEAVTAFISILSNLFRLHVNNLPNAS